MTKINQEASQDVHVKIQKALDDAFTLANSNFSKGVAGTYNLSTTLSSSLEELSRKSQKAASGFTNIVTCLAIKAALPNVDIRYHQTQIQDQTDRPARFNFRGVSERTVAPWLSQKHFEGAKSGWQTRTFERPKPYMITYDENISDIKEPFLNVFDQIEEHAESGRNALVYLIHLQLIHRESKKITLSIPKTSDIQLIIKVFREHFFYSYKETKGASRLPVLALYAVYEVLIEQINRYAGMSLRPLEQHSAADSQTGAVGDIEIVDEKTGNVFEAVEVKHDVALSERIIHDAALKIMDKKIDRYYILTTHGSCEPDLDLLKKISNIKALYNCQVIANGLVPSLKYYLRLLSDPSLVFPRYVALLLQDKTVKHEHREVWNKLAIEG
jgi:DNA (cytosine-5)-methyltransferase 1